MTNEDYIQKGYQLIGWDHVRYKALIAKVGPEIVHDHIAAKLVRQVDALENDAALVSKRGECVVTNYLSPYPQKQWAEESRDRSMNIIIAVIESTVLQQQEQK